MKYIMGIWSVLSSLTGVFSQNLSAFGLFDARGKPISYEKMVAELSQADVILFGEYHDNPICHWLQIRLAKDLHAANRDRLVLGAEMFEADNQLILDEYLAGHIKENHLTDEAKVWNNFKTDYKPLVEFAKEKQIRFVATNIPRRYASMVARMGEASLNALKDEAKAFIVPLPLVVDMELPQYKKMMAEMGGPHAGQNMIKAQAIKDATMAHFILANFEKGKLFYHLNGTYHSDFFEGIVWYLKRQNPDLKIVTIGSRLSEEPSKFDAANSQSASFILQIHSDITKSY